MKIQRASLIFFCSLLVLFSYGQNSDFNTTNSIVYSENNEITAFVDTTFKGKRSLKLDSKQQAIAIKESLNLKNFRLEMDIAGEVMSGLGFRVADEQNYQFIYFRPGYGGTQEAIQYIPIYNGALSWVFYNYPTYETKADIQSLEWFHTTIEVKGNILKVFVNNSQTPQMEVELLNTKSPGGKLLLRSMFGTSYFANVKVEALPDTEAPKSIPKQETFLTEWQISESFPRNSTEKFNRLLERAQKMDRWQLINESKDSYVNFCRYFNHPDGIIVAKKQLVSKKKVKKALHFDFVGKLQVVLNGEVIFNYDKYRFERIFDGSFRIMLDLKKGKNELFVITEGDASAFGEGYKSMGRLQHQNWGFIARIEE